MPIDRIKWQPESYSISTPSWPCPTCNSGVLLLQRESIKKIASKGSEYDPYNPSSNPWDEHGRFIGLLKCNRQSCGETVVIAGTYVNDLEFNDEGDPYSEEYLKLSFIDPAPHPFSIPANCPQTVADQLKESFQLFWIDLNATANKVRSAVEHLMDYRRVKTRIRTKKGKLEPLSLHARIEIFQQNQKDLGDLLLAIKWIGNSGSHREKLKREDVLDAFDIIDHVLQEMIAQRPKQIARLARQINKAKGPRSKTKKNRKKR